MDGWMDGWLKERGRGGGMVVGREVKGDCVVRKKRRVEMRVGVEREG